MDFTIKITGDEINIIGLALQKQPFKMVEKVILKLRQQVTEQTKKEEIKIEETKTE